MTSWMKWVAAPVAALAFVLSTAALVVRAEDGTAGKGSISGKVVDGTGAAVADAMVRVVAAGEKNATKLDSPIGLEEDGGAKKDKGGKNGKPPAVAEGKTDAEGKFSLSGIPAGKYAVHAMLKGKGRGNAKVTVEDGKTADVGTITLAEKPK